MSSYPILTPAGIRTLTTQEVLDILPPESEWTQDLIEILRIMDLHEILMDRGVEFSFDAVKSDLVDLVMNSQPPRTSGPSGPPLPSELRNISYKNRIDLVRQYYDRPEDLHDEVMRLWYYNQDDIYTTLDEYDISSLMDYYIRKQLELIDSNQLSVPKEKKELYDSTRSLEDNLQAEYTILTPLILDYERKLRRYLDIDVPEVKEAKRNILRIEPTLTTLREKINDIYSSYLNEQGITDIQEKMDEIAQLDPRFQKEEDYESRSLYLEEDEKAWSILSYFTVPQLRDIVARINLNPPDLIQKNDLIATILDSPFRCVNEIPDDIRFYPKQFRGRKYVERVVGYTDLSKIPRDLAVRRQWDRQLFDLFESEESEGRGYMFDLIPLVDSNNNLADVASTELEKYPIEDLEDAIELYFDITNAEFSRFDLITIYRFLVNYRIRKGESFPEEYREVSPGELGFSEGMGQIYSLLQLSHAGVDRRNVETLVGAMAPRVERLDLAIPDTADPLPLDSDYLNIITRLDSLAIPTDRLIDNRELIIRYNNAIKKEECVVCYAEGNPCLDCSHCVCSECIVNLIKKECPICRQTLAGVNFDLVVELCIEDNMENRRIELARQEDEAFRARYGNYDDDEDDDDDDDGDGNSGDEDDEENVIDDRTEPDDEELIPDQNEDVVDIVTVVDANGDLIDDETIYEEELLEQFLDDD